MKIKYALAVLFLCLVAPSALLAQRYEANVFAGGFFPTTTDNVGRFRNEGEYGVRGGYFATSNLEISFSGAYIDHFDLKSNNPLVTSLSALGFSRPPIRAGLWDLTGDYNLRTRSILGIRVEPILTVGAGFVDMSVHSIVNPTPADRLLPGNAECGVALVLGGCGPGEVIIAGGGNVIANAPPGTFTGGSPASFPAGQRTILASSNTFLSFTYGAGIRAPHLLGPIGFRLDVRGRTMPNFFGSQSTWPEATGGLTLEWGER